MPYNFKIKKLILLLAYSLSAISANSQHIWGLKVGLNLADQTKTFISPQDNVARKQPTKSLLGYQLGVFYKLKIETNWMMAVEANYSIIGSRSRYLEEDQLFNPTPRYFNEKITYIEIPVILQYYFKKIYFGTGPAVGLKLFSKITHFENDNTFNAPYYKIMDLSANLMWGLKIAKHWDVNLRSSNGLLNVHQKHHYVRTKNRFLNLSILYSFNGTYGNRDHNR